MYALTLGNRAPSKREDGVDEEEGDLPTIGVEAALQAAARLEQLGQQIDQKAAASLARAQQLAAEIAALQVTYEAKVAAANDEVNALHDDLDAADTEYQEAYSVVEEAWNEWTYPPPEFNSIYDNARADFSDEISDIYNIYMELPTV